jgi:hypothetical protein
VVEDADANVAAACTAAGTGAVGMSVVEGTAGTAAVEDEAVGRVVGDPGAGSAVDVASNTGHRLDVPRD